jgi:hypothetical protein
MYTRSRKDSDAEMDIYINEGTMDRGDGSSIGSGGSADGDLQFIILSLVVSAIVIFFL